MVLITSITKLRQFCFISIFFQKGLRNEVRVFQSLSTAVPYLNRMSFVCDAFDLEFRINFVTGLGLYVFLYYIRH